jgi:hypothetical protein
MEKETLTAAVCGLFCESCGAYIATRENTLEPLAQKFGRPAEEIQCKGCRSDTLSFYCRTMCKMKGCAADKGLQFCSECDAYPCVVLKEFQSQAPHRLELFSSLDYIKENGEEKWLCKMRGEYACAECGTINSIYQFDCRKCGHDPSSPFVERNREEIIKAMKK